MREKPPCSSDGRSPRFPSSLRSRAHPLAGISFHSRVSASFLFSSPHPRRPPNSSLSLELQGSETRGWTASSIPSVQTKVVQRKSTDGLWLDEEERLRPLVTYLDFWDCLFRLRAQIPKCAKYESPPRQIRGTYYSGPCIGECPQ